MMSGTELNVLAFSHCMFGTIFNPVQMCIGFIHWLLFICLFVYLLIYCTSIPLLPWGLRAVYILVIIPTLARAGSPT